MNKIERIAESVIADKVEYDGYDGSPGAWRIFFKMGGKVYGYETWDRALVDDVEYMAKRRKSPGKALGMVKKLPYKKYKS